MKKTVQRRFAFALAAMLIFSLLPAVSLAAENTTEFLGGSGVEGDPYLISNKEHFLNVANYPDAHFLLLTDIILDEIDLGPGGLYEEWEPIGTKSAPFSGVFDGDGHTVANFFYDSEYQNLAGLFGWNTGTVKNLRVEDSYFRCIQYAGGIAGCNEGTVSGCYSNAEVYAVRASNKREGYGGGICGYNSGTVTQCMFAGDAYAWGNTYGHSGGIVGLNEGTVEQCINSGTVWGMSNQNARSGGIAGYIKAGTVKNCYSTGKIGEKGASYYPDCVYRFGGVAGVVAEGAELSCCYSIGRVYVEESPADAPRYTSGGVAGSVFGTVENCFYLEGTATVGANKGAEDVSFGCTGLSVSQMTDPASYAGFDFEQVWQLDTGLDYAFAGLQAFAGCYQPAAGNNADFAGGTGALWDPYIIRDAQQLNSIRQYPDACFRLESDIWLYEEDFAAGGVFFNDGKKWKPIPHFTGVLDGNGHSVSGLQIGDCFVDEAAGTLPMAGLVGINDGIIKNLTLQGVSVKLDQSLSKDPVYAPKFGTLCYSNTGSVENCSVTGSIQITLTEEMYYKANYTPSGNYVIGGIVGSNAGKLVNCKNAADITVKYACETDNRLCVIKATVNVGGIAGVNSSSMLNCTYTGDISLEQIQDVYGAHRGGELSLDCFVGGLCGDNTGTVKQSGFAGDVTVKVHAKAKSASPGSAYFGGADAIIHFKDYIGGLVGRNKGTVDRCYAKGSMTVSEDMSSTKDGQRGYYAFLEEYTYVGGAVGKQDTGAILSDCYADVEMTGVGSMEYTYPGMSQSRMGEIFTYIGGLVGSSGGTIKCCYVTGSLSASFPDGRPFDSGTYQASCHDGTVLGIVSAICSDIYYREGFWSGEKNGTPIPVEQMTLPESFGEFDFETVWCFDSGEGYLYPRLQWELGALEKLELVGNPAPVSTVEGVMPEVSHIQVQLTYSTGKTSTVALDESYLSLLDLTQIGTQTVPVTIRGVTSDKKLTVEIRPKSLAYIQMENVPVNTDYFLTGETVELDLLGATVQAVYDNGTFDSVPVTEEMVSSLEQKPGVQNVTVTYAGYSTSFAVNVYEPVSAWIDPPYKTTYVQGQPLELNGGYLYVTFQCEGNSKELDFSLEDAQISYDEKALGDVTVTASFCGVSDSFQITVSERKIRRVRLVQPDKISYTVGEELDLTGGQLEYVYESFDGYTEYVDLTLDMLSGYDLNVPGIQTVTVKAENYSGSFIIRVKERKIASVELTTLPANLTYTEGTEAPDVSGGVLTVTYDDGATAEVALTADMVSGFDGSKAGTQTLTVTYKDFTASYDVTVEHVYTAQVTEPTCTESGFTTYSCACGDSYTDDITAPLGHVEIIDEGKEVTCLEDGITEGSHCDRCAEVLVQQEIVPAKGHNWGQWVETVKPDETRDGVDTRVCTACGETETKVIDNNIFTDVKKDRFEAAILWAYYNNITTGTGDGTTFSPENACTRKQIVTFLWRAAGEPEPESMVNPFKDVKSDRFEKAILWAYYAGITAGTGDGSTFSPENTCTRKQIVTFLWRYNGQPAPKSMENKFVDVKNDRFTAAILWAAEQGITTGTGDGTTFSPEDPCTRKQIVTFLYRNLNKEEDK